MSVFSILHTSCTIGLTTSSMLACPSGRKECARRSPSSRPHSAETPVISGPKDFGCAATAVARQPLFRKIILERNVDVGAAGVMRALGNARRHNRLRGWTQLPASNRAP